MVKTDRAYTPASLAPAQIPLGLIFTQQIRWLVRQNDVTQGDFLEFNPFKSEAVLN